MSVYIDKQKDRPDFYWDSDVLMPILAEARYRQGLLAGRMEGIGSGLRKEALLEALTIEVVRSAELEGERLSAAQVRSSLASRLNVRLPRAVPAGIDAAAAAGMIADVLAQCGDPLTERRLADWHQWVMPVKHKRHNRMVHFQRPEVQGAPARFRAFLHWFNNSGDTDPVIKAAVAHWWFSTLHPFDGGNGRIARAIADMQLARCERNGARYFSLSDAFWQERDVYARFMAETRKSDTHKGPQDITRFLEWFLHRLGTAVAAADNHLSPVLRKAAFWEQHAGNELNERQRQVLALLLDGIDGKLTSSRWARLTATSSDTAVRDINELVRLGVLVKEAAGGRSTNYVLAGA
ncbi:MAG TPA: DUF4172 domain-containing protein [Puia sp.]|nr:DUF4172 domain-containing protein [Puia sp.]